MSGEMAITGYNGVEELKSRENDKASGISSVEKSNKNIDVAGAMKSNPFVDGGEQAPITKDDIPFPQGGYEKPSYNYENGRLSSIIKNSKDGSSSVITYYGDDGKVSGTRYQIKNPNNPMGPVEYKDFDSAGKLSRTYKEENYNLPTGTLNSKVYKTQGEKGSTMIGTEYDKDSNKVSTTKIFPEGTVRKEVYDGDRTLIFDKNDNVIAQIN